MTISRLVLFAALGLATALPAQLSGPYVVGPGGSFPDIASAIGVLTTSGVSGPVSFLVTANDAGSWTLGAFPGQGPTNPVVFDGQGTVTLTGAQPVLTLNGCASVTFRGFNASFTSSTNAFVVNAGTTDCVFTGCNFLASTTTTGNTPGTTAVFNLAGGTRCRIEDSMFGGSWEALYVGITNDGTIVQRCRIIGGGWWIMRLGGSNCTLINNFIYGVSNYGISGGVSGLANGANLRIRHNSVFINHPTSGSQYCSLRWYSNAAGSEVVDNIFYDSYPTSSTTVFNVWCLSGLRPVVMNYNDLWSNQPGYTPVFATTNQTLAGWQALGFDLNSIQADPMYIAPAITPPDLRIMTGSPCATAGLTLTGVLTDFFQAARTTPVSIGAHEEAGGPGAYYAVFAGGCAGTAGVPTNTAWPPPAIGTTSLVTFGNLPVTNVVIMVFGLSNTTSALGPLPYSLAPFGAPGCTARVSLDSSVFLAGSGGSATFNMVVPNQQQLLGLQVYTQGLVLDPGRNAMNAVTSDAAAILVGL